MPTTTQVTAAVAAATSATTTPTTPSRVQTSSLERAQQPQQEPGTQQQIQSPISPGNGSSRGRRLVRSSMTGAVDDGQVPSTAKEDENHDGDQRTERLSEIRTNNGGSRQSRGESSRLGSLEGVPEDGAMLRFSSFRHGSSTSGRGGSGKRDAEEEEDIEEEIREEIEDALEEKGLYPGSYKRLVALYSLTPFIALIIFVVLFSVQTLFPSDSQYPYNSALFPFPLPEAFIGLGMFAIQAIVRQPVYSFFEWLFLQAAPNDYCSGPRRRFHLRVVAILRTIVPTLVHAFVQVALRLAITPLLLIPQTMKYPYPTFRDAVFRQLWMASVFYSLGETLLVIKHGYDAIAAYRDVLVSVRTLPSSPPQLPVSSGSSVPSEQRLGSSSSAYGREVVKHVEEEDDGLSLSDDEGGDGMTNGSKGSRSDKRRLLVDIELGSGDAERRGEDEEEEEEEELLESLLRARQRRDIEDVYGIAFIRIPPFLPPLQRLSTPLLGIGLNLLLSWSFIKAPWSTSSHDVGEAIYKRQAQIPLAVDGVLAPSYAEENIVYFATTFPLAILLVAGVDVLAVSGGSVGPQTIIYVTFLISLLVFFGGLGVWDLL